MQVFKVGGCVRDYVMGFAPKDIDYVVVGSSPEEMLAKGYEQVGAGFPVFLHPKTREEYALARTEVKSGEGYNGFSTEWEGVSLEEDLSRRDLTINAMARGSDGLIDPFNGRQDIEDKVLRHTSEAFADDPVRVLRIGRFLARWGSEWTVAPETYALCQKVAWSEFKNLTAERVFLEMDKALREPYPRLFFEFLYMLDYVWFKELFALKGIPQPVKHHPENDTFEHVMLCLEQGVRLGGKPFELFAILCHDLGKAPCWNANGNLYGHESGGVKHVETLCDRLKVPNSYRDLAVKVCKWHTHNHRIFDMRAVKVYELLINLDVFRNNRILESFVLCNMADACGRTGFEDSTYPQAQYLHHCAGAAILTLTDDVLEECKQKGLIGKKIGDKIRQKRIKEIEGVKRIWSNTRKS